MGQVNRIPRGFLDLVGAQTQGKNPPLFSDGLSPVVDMTALYLAETTGVANTNFAHTVVGNVGTITIPQDETWSVIAVGSQSVVALASEFEQIEWQTLRLPRQVAVGTVAGTFHVTPLMSVSTLNQTLSSGFVLPRPLVLNGGVQIQARIAQRDGSASRTTAIVITANILSG